MTIVEAPDLADFRVGARHWLEGNARRRRKATRTDGDEALVNDLETGDDPGTVARAREFQARLYDAGYAGLTWPREVGGRGLPREYQVAFEQEAAGFDLPSGMIFTIGVGMCGPTLMELGREDQKQRYLRRILRGDDIWCQLFSEPGAGSDLASVQARAVRDGDEWVLTGQKVWTSGAHYSQYGLAIVRTDADVPKHRGITMFVIEMTSPGIMVRPLRQMTGQAHFNEVFFDGVRVPDENVVGGVNDGWRAALTMLANERMALGAGGRGSGDAVQGLIRLARERGMSGDPRVRQQLVDLWVRQQVLRYVVKRVSDAAKAGKLPGPEGSVLKLAGTTLARRVSDLAVVLAGLGGVAWSAGDRRAERRTERFLSAPAGGIAGGSDEVQRNIVGERVLGLPKEPQVDLDVPFRELTVGTQR